MVVNSSSSASLADQQVRRFAKLRRIMFACSSNALVAYVTHLSSLSAECHVTMLTFLECTALLPCSFFMMRCRQLDKAAAEQQRLQLQQSVAARKRQRQRQLLLQQQEELAVAAARCAYVVGIPEEEQQTCHSIDNDCLVLPIERVSPCSCVMHWAGYAVEEAMCLQASTPAYTLS